MIIWLFIHFFFSLHDNRWDHASPASPDCMLLRCTYFWDDGTLMTFKVWQHLQKSYGTFASLLIKNMTYSLFFLNSLASLAKYLVIWGIHVSPSQGRDEFFGEKGQDERGQDYQKIFILGGRERKDKNLRGQVNFKRGVWDFRGTDYVISN